MWHWQRLRETLGGRTSSDQIGRLKTERIETEKENVVRYLVVVPFLTVFLQSTQCRSANAGEKSTKGVQTAAMAGGSRTANGHVAAKRLKYTVLDTY